MISFSLFPRRISRLLASSAFFLAVVDCSSDQSAKTTSSTGGADASDLRDGGSAGSDGATVEPLHHDALVGHHHLRRLGLGTYGSVTVLPGGRTLTPAGVHAVTGGFPADARLHPTLPLAYVANTGYGDAYRSLQVVSTETGALVQEITRGDSFYGIALSVDGKRLYASGGFSSLVDVYDVDTDGKLSAQMQLAVDKYPAGLALSRDGKKLWVAQFKGNAVVEFDTTSLSKTRSISVPVGPYNLLEVPERQELYVAGFADDRVAIVDLTSTLNATLTTITVGSDPLGLVKSPAGERVYVTATNGDALVVIDTAKQQVVNTQAVGEASIHGDDGKPLPATSPGGLAIDSKGRTLYVARAADNAVSLFDAATLGFKGSIPTAWYPTSVILSKDDGHMFVTNGKGLGPGPQRDATPEAGKVLMKGSVSIVDLPRSKRTSAGPTRCSLSTVTSRFRSRLRPSSNRQSSTSCSSFAKTRPTTRCSAISVAAKPTPRWRSTATRSPPTSTPSRASSRTRTISTTTPRRACKGTSG